MIYTLFSLNGIYCLLTWLTVKHSLTIYWHQKWRQLMKFPASTATPSLPPLPLHHHGPLHTHALMNSWRVTLRHRSPKWPGLKISPLKIQANIFNLGHFKDTAYDVMPWAVLVTQLVWWQAENAGRKREGRGRKSSSQQLCHALWSNATRQGLQKLILSTIPFGILTWMLQLLKFVVLTPWCPRDETFRLLCMTSNCTGRQRVAQSLGFYGWNGW